MIIKSYFALLLLQIRATLLHIDTCLTACSILEFGRYIYIYTNQRSKGISAVTDRINYSEEGGNKFIRNSGTHVEKYKASNRRMQ